MNFIKDACNMDFCTWNNVIPKYPYGLG